MIQLKKIAKICKRAMSVKIDEVGGHQWMGGPMAMYCMDGFPDVDYDTAPAMLDIPTSEREKFVVEMFGVEPERAPQYREFPAGEDPNERTLLSNIVMKYRGAEYIILTVGGGLALIDADYIAPIKPDGAGTAITYHARRDEAGELVIAVKEGMLLRAVIRPSFDAEMAMAKEIRVLADKWIREGVASE